MKRFLFLREAFFLKTMGTLLLITISFSTLLILFFNWSGVPYNQPKDIFNIVSLFSLFGIFLTSDHLFKEEIEQGVFEIYFLRNTSFLALALSRMITYTFIVIAPLSGLNLFFVNFFTGFPITWQAYGFSFFFFICYALTVITGSVLTHGADQQKAFVFLICLPIIIPIFLTQAFIFSNFNNPEALVTVFKLVVGLGLLMIPLNLFLLTMGLNFAMKLR
jgi:ABC-type transport system involved in cytochrome c biogenesis permease component